MDPVPRIQRKIKDLNSRYKIVSRLISPVAKRGENTVVNLKSIGGYTFIIGVSDSYEHGIDYQKWRFRTKVKNISGLYYERWNQYDSDVYYLDRIYFHLVKYDTISMVEDDYILLHCDSSEPDSTIRSKYKQSPHLHICCAEQPVPHSHIALADNISQIYESLDSLDLSIKKAVELLNVEILDRL